MHHALTHSPACHICTDLNLCTRGFFRGQVKFHRIFPASNPRYVRLSCHYSSARVFSANRFLWHKLLPSKVRRGLSACGRGHMHAYHRNVGP